MFIAETAAISLGRILRAARQDGGLSIAQLAALARVSPRLISEVERGTRPHVSFETAIRLLDLVGVAVAFQRRSPAETADAARRARAELRARTWSGERTTLAREAPPPPASSPAARLAAVARASRLTGGLQAAYRKTATPRTETPRE